LDHSNCWKKYSRWASGTDGLPTCDPLKSLLTHRGLLTEALQAYFGSEISVRLCQQSTTDQKQYLRRVLLVCGAAPLVYAETLIHSKTLCRYPWLTDLGTHPLGASMSVHGELTRSDFEYRWLPPADEFHVRALEHAGVAGTVRRGLWARRSNLALHQPGVQITEVFLPTLASAT